ncbi:MAG: hypothetical protein ACR2IB_05350 [Pyrinomonadaceae bacterium]
MLSIEVKPDTPKKLPKGIGVLANGRPLDLLDYGSWPDERRKVFNQYESGTEVSSAASPAPDLVVVSLSALKVQSCELGF